MIKNIHIVSYFFLLDKDDEESSSDEGEDDVYVPGGNKLDDGQTLEVKT